MNEAAQIRFTPGTVISRRISGQDSACCAISFSTAAISASRNSTWRMPASTDSRSSNGSSRVASHWRPLTPNRSEHGGLACSRRCRHAWISFLARERERTSCSRRASRRRRIRQRSSGIHTASSSPRHSKLANARASSLSVFARALVIPVSSGETTTTRLTCGSRIRATSQQLPVTSNATRSDVNRLSASDRTPSGVAGTLPADRTSPSSQIATSQKSRCTSKPIARPTHLGTPIPHLRQLDLSERENQRDNDTDRYELEAQSRQVAGAAKRTARARSPSIKTAYPSTFSQESPCPGSPEPTADP